MSDTPTPRFGEQIVYLLDDTMNEVEAVPAEFARQLERELAEVTQSLAFQKQLNREVIEREKQTHAELAETNKDYRCLAELLDGHDATECRANLVKLKDAVQTLNDCADYLNRRLAVERALADRLATWAQEHRNAYMGQVPDVDCGCGDCQILPVLDADLAAWKEARK